MLGAVADNFAIDEDGFHILKAANAPAGDRHLFAFALQDKSIARGKAVFEGIAG
jgi:hypothetical protein